MNAMNAINAMTKKQNNATTCNQPNDATKVTPAHYEELEELQLESVAAANIPVRLLEYRKRNRLLDWDYEYWKNEYNLMNMLYIYPWNHEYWNGYWYRRLGMR